MRGGPLVALLLVASAAPDSAPCQVASSPPDSATLRSSPSTGALGWSDLLRGEEDFVFTQERSRHPLAHPFLLLGSELVTAEGDTLVRNQDYGIDYTRGVLFLLAPAEGERRLQIRYQYIPGLQQQHFRATRIVSREEALQTENGAQSAPDPGAAAALRPRATGSVGLPQGLQLAGSKTIGVNFGQNREATLEQSLRVQVSGLLGEDLRVNAVLSDDNLPVLPEGNTEELGDLNKVFIELQGPVVGGVVGDYPLQRDSGEFTRFERELRGGEARLKLGQQRFALAAGLAKGELVTTTFRGIEGKQGPYELLSARRLDFSTILPGSERVYLDGQLLRRGESQDYVIDYDRGELRFTSRRRVTADSEITLDFQVSTERYHRETRAARLEAQRGGWKLNSFFLHEGDDRDRPVGDDLTVAEAAALQAAGDRIAIAPGIREVEPGRGLYRYCRPSDPPPTCDPADSSIVRYDPILGDLEVDFYESGSGAGSYEDSLDVLTGRRFFTYVGPGAGSFEIGSRVSPPNRTQLAGAQVEGNLWRGARVVAEASVSEFDGNLYSPRDDEDNVGEAIDVRFDSGDRELGRLGRTGVTAHVSQLSARFRPPGRARAGFYYKEWNAEQDTLQGVERLAETTLRSGWGGDTPWLRLEANVGRLDRGADLNTDRGQLDLRLGRLHERGAELRWQSLETQRRLRGEPAPRSRELLRGGARYRFGIFLPEVQFESDEFVRAEIDSLVRRSYRYLDQRYRLGIGGQGRTRATLEFGRRDTDARSAAGEGDDGRSWQPERRNDTYALTLLGRPSRALSTEIYWSRRTNLPRQSAAGAETRSDLARGSLSWSPRERALRGEMRYEISDEVVRKLEQVLVLSPDGRGDYDAEGRPVGKDQGEYDKIFRSLGESESVKQISASMRFEMGGGVRFGGVDTTGSWFRRNVSVVQFLSVQEQTRSASRQLYWLLPSAFQGDETVFGSFRARQEWSFLNAVREHSLRLLLSWEDDLDGRFGDQRVDTQRGRATLRYENASASPWTAGGESAWGRRRRRGPLGAAIPGRPSSDSHDVGQQSVSARLGYRLSANERVSMELTTTRQQDALSETRQFLFELSPSLILAPVKNLRIFASIATTRVLESKPDEVLPPFFFDAPGTKTTASLTSSYRIGRSLNLNLSYAGVRNTDGRTRYDVKAETRAIF